MFHPLPFLLLATVALAAEIPAFPGAEGAGKFTAGGRGGTVYRVTNLNASGPGSLADAVSQPHRFVVFTVSGIIDLRRAKAGGAKGGAIEMMEPHVTIAGQTAPGEGICLKGGELKVGADDIIVQHIRSRRGWLREGDSGDAIEVKPVSSGEESTAIGRSPEALAKIAAKKAERGKYVHAPGLLTGVMFDHLSTSWATDENLSVTHADKATVQYCIAAEGLDYPNPKQTPPRHSEGSLWGSSAPEGSSTMHHMLYASNRLRNPRTTGGAMPPPTMTFFNSVVYNWLEHASHTGSEIVQLNWLNNYYQPGTNTPAGARIRYFEFEGDPAARIFARGNVLKGMSYPGADAGVEWGEKLRKLSPEEKRAMIVDAAFPAALPEHLETAEEALETTLRDSGATLPARDSVDARIVDSVRHKTGRIIEKETDLEENERWPDYRSLPSPPDRDQDGIPDFWEAQFGLNPDDATDSARVAAGGYTNIEHYCHNTDPTGGSVPIVSIAGLKTRAAAGRPGEWALYRTGDCKAPLKITVVYSGDASPAFNASPEHVTFPAGASRISLSVGLPATSEKERTLIVSLKTGEAAYHVGCPSQSLVVISGEVK